MFKDILYMERKHKSYCNFLPFHDGWISPPPPELNIFKYWEQEKHLDLKTGLADYHSEKGPLNKELKILS